MDTKSQLSFEEIEALYSQYSDRIYKFFYYKFLSKPLAEDLTSETFLQFITEVKKGKSIENSKNFLYGIAKIIFINALKSKYKRNEVAIDSIDNIESDYVDEFIETTEEKVSAEDRLLVYIEKIPSKQAEIIKLRLIEKLSLGEICEKLNKDMNYVKVTQRRAIKSLRTLMACTPFITKDMSYE